MPTRLLTCTRCGAINPRAAVRCLDCGFDLRVDGRGRASGSDAKDRLSSTRFLVGEPLPVIHLSTRDFARLENLARIKLSAADPVRKFLLNELDRAVVLNPAEISSDIVEVGDWVEYRNVDGARSEKRRLVFPDDLHPGEDAVSVLTSIGVAILGLKEGSTMPFNMPDGSMASVRVNKVAACFAAPAHTLSERRPWVRSAAVGERDMRSPPAPIQN